MKRINILISVFGIVFLSSHNASAQWMDVLKIDSTHFTGEYFSDSSEYTLFHDRSGATVRILRTDILKARPVEEIKVVTSADNKMRAIVTTKGGKEIRGLVIRENSDTLLLRSEDSSIIEINRNNISNVKYVEPRKSSDFPALGAVFGTPGGLNVVLGYHGQTFGIRLSGMYLGKVSGSQIEFPVCVSRNNESSKYIAPLIFQTDLTLTRTSTSYFGGTYSYDEHDFFTGFGLAYEYTGSGGFDWQIGLTYGHGTFGSIQLIFQIGYVHEFR